MLKKSWKTILIWILASEAVGFLAGILSRSGMRAYEETALQPPLSPPMWLFPVVWAILYALMGIGAGLVFLQPPSQGRSRSLNLMIAQLVINFFWPLIFFNLQAYGLSLVWLILLWVLVLLMILQMRRVLPLAAWLQVPYLLWLTFALYLNAGVWYLNR